MAKHPLIALDLLVFQVAVSLLDKRSADDGADVQFKRTRLKPSDDLCPEDTLANDTALTHGGRLLSAYGQGDGRFWVITEADYSATTVLLPEDY